MAEKCWKAKWISDCRFDGSKPNEELLNQHMLVRKILNVPEGVNKAGIDISADDYYKLYINGHFVGQGPAPAYHFHYNYNRFDIMNYLVEGDNVITVHVYYQGLVNRVWNSGDLRQGLIAEVFLNGELSLFTDETWRYTLAEEFCGTKTVGYDTQFLEDIDSRVKLNNWRMLAFDDSQWKKACIQLEDDHELFLQITPPVEVYSIKPDSVKEIGPNHYLIDFGHEVTGQFTMTAQGASGQVVEILCGEEMDESGERVRYEMRCNCDYQEQWTLSGGIDVLEQFDYKALRYVEVIAPKDVVDIESFAFIVRHYPFNEEMSSFSSSDPLLNSIWAICKNGVKYGAQEGFLDCPGREKGQYLGDSTITALSHMYLTGDSRLFKKSLSDFALSANICPGLMAVAPGSFKQEIADFSLQWPLQLLNYYNFSGDIEFLNEMLPVAEGVLNYFKRYERGDGLIENVKGKWNLVDWPANLRDGYDFDLSDVVGDGCHNVINAFYCGAVKTVNEIRRVLGRNQMDDFSKLQNAYIKTFFDSEALLFKDSEISRHHSLHSNAIALYFDLAPSNATKSIVEFLKMKRLSCGVYFAYFLLKGLARFGEYDLIYDLISSDDEHSWGNMVREGASTCFEAWGKDQKWNTSLCHPWASAPISVIIEDLAGVTIAKPGWEEIEFLPHFPKRLNDVELKFSTPKGTIKIESKNGENSIEVPEGVIISSKK